jgi:hypothetical protein
MGRPQRPKAVQRQCGSHSSVSASSSSHGNRFYGLTSKDAQCGRCFSETVASRSDGGGDGVDRLVVVPPNCFGSSSAGTVQLRLSGDGVGYPRQVGERQQSRSAEASVYAWAQPMPSGTTREGNLLPITRDIALANHAVVSRHGESL